jgi:hypothetical protein
MSLSQRVVPEFEELMGKFSENSSTVAGGLRKGKACLGSDQPLILKTGSRP